MPLVTHPVRSLWGSQPRCARCVCEWLHRKWDGASLPYPGGEGGTSILISIEVISCFGAREYTSWNLNLLWSVGKLGSTDVNSNAALHGETILALWDLICYFKCILNFEIWRELGNENIFWNAKYKRYYNATRCVNSWGDLGDWSAGFPGLQVQYSHWFLCWWPCCLHLEYLRSGDYADWSSGFPMSKMKGNMCNFVLVWVFECGVLFVILSTSVIVKQIRLLVKGAQVLSVSLTSLPYLGVGDPKWGLLRACVLGLKYY